MTFWIVFHTNKLCFCCTRLCSFCFPLLLSLEQLRESLRVILCATTNTNTTQIIHRTGSWFPACIFPTRTHWWDHCILIEILPNTRIDRGAIPILALTQHIEPLYTTPPKCLSLQMLKTPRRNPE